LPIRYLDLSVEIHLSHTKWVYVSLFGNTLNSLSSHFKTGLAIIVDRESLIMCLFVGDDPQAEGEGGQGRDRAPMDELLGENDMGDEGDGDEDGEKSPVRQGRTGLGIHQSAHFSLC
jgi:hypothetical protein